MGTASPSPFATPELESHRNTGFASSIAFIVRRMPAKPSPRDPAWALLLPSGLRNVTARSCLSRAIAEAEAAFHFRCGEPLWLPHRFIRSASQRESRKWKCSREPARFHEHHDRQDSMTDFMTQLVRLCAGCASSLLRRKGSRSGRQTLLTFSSIDRVVMIAVSRSLIEREVWRGSFSLGKPGCQSFLHCRGSITAIVKPAFGKTGCEATRTVIKVRKLRANDHSCALIIRFARKVLSDEVRCS